jgi:hypothetical protein
LKYNLLKKNKKITQNSIVICNNVIPHSLTIDNNNLEALSYEETIQFTQLDQMIQIAPFKVTTLVKRHNRHTHRNTRE